MKTEILQIAPVLPSANIERDVKWYGEKAGFKLLSGDTMYAVLKRENIYVHLQWHADTDDDPLNGGSVMKIFVKNIQAIFEEFITRGTVTKEKLRLNTSWGTNEFGFYDLNNNAVFIVEDI
ncbi:glyoxalase/bleomycin resistance/extradiol dioxygenase family protein [Roseivirga echinicomitans]|uniref:Bleomycin resistance protein n=1 Tax=Roseivirga echinicomitans TaxID=296218 RepID=A0A150WYJ3_9BACT|nr:glyoxalase/bleomycin resistance/extradiol dioxygenase family protein [Roseivirga echinicomitans]KYG71553.1 bleomycin resistance protein [Roseivirga echinicomitans]